MKWFLTFQFGPSSGDGGRSRPFSQHNQVRSDCELRVHRCISVRYIACSFHFLISFRISMRKRWTTMRWLWAPISWVMSTCGSSIHTMQARLLLLLILLLLTTINYYGESLVDVGEACIHRVPFFPFPFLKKCTACLIFIQMISATRTVSATDCSLMLWIRR